MPKLKVHRGTKKRIRLTGNGKMLRRRAFGNHFLAKKSSSRKRGLSKEYQLKTGDKSRIKRSLGV